MWSKRFSVTLSTALHSIHLFSLVWLFWLCSFCFNLPAPLNRRPKMVCLADRHFRRIEIVSSRRAPFRDPGRPHKAVQRSAFFRPFCCLFGALSWLTRTAMTVPCLTAWAVQFVTIKCFLFRNRLFVERVSTRDSRAALSSAQSLGTGVKTVHKLWHIVSLSRSQSVFSTGLPFPLDLRLCHTRTQLSQLIKARTFYLKEGF